MLWVNFSVNFHVGKGFISLAQKSRFNIRVINLSNAKFCIDKHKKGQWNIGSKVLLHINKGMVFLLYKEDKLKEVEGNNKIMQNDSFLVCLVKL